MKDLTVFVETANHRYPIYIVNNTDYAQYILPYIKGQHLLIVTNETIAPLYLDKLIDSIENDTLICPKQRDNKKVIKTCILADGEEHKHQESINKIYDVLLDNHFSRDATLLALGGGVIGDMTGFAAASYMRGVNFIQMPTTLLSQVDSSVGGKTGINHKLGKNMIGAFWQPQVVLADMNTLSTLPRRELSAGMAEVIKYALIMDIEFLAWLENNADTVMNLDCKSLAYIVQKCCQLKAQIVEEDERESGKRVLLNFGHTFGHVIETYEGYGKFLHGEAVAIGMVQAVKLSEMQGWLTKNDVQRVINILQLYELPVTAPNIPIDKALTLMSHDKKSVSGNIRLILLKALGDAIVTTDFNETKLKDVLS